MTKNIEELYQVNLSDCLKINREISVSKKNKYELIANRKCRSKRIIECSEKELSKMFNIDIEINVSKKEQ